ncbi:alpha/beta hydrolase [Agrobacterium rosae]|uniref:Alpha/beta hydrolase n=3 Tax=Pseudomonadota TaxID=1224 RepID=A0A1R3TS20_9HYPH|nr:alpha/beta fold hydrolase [Agrobacterium rosae]SCX30834.1 Alpha/beta hydrolase family protein [Agrobacterium sp. DSM 25558]KAA3511683.1 alpha/beta fold hydrolase [Agrobacterium rosae]KAA3518896.1 alpha/beta fold hydrolase [Agrobacterium rosae]MBN7806715.1 alpha/beta fold hydrolase [Agrobacterium rosae]MCM2435133.1 alpha/beta fold hydrolase [Agrobacterium rosae]
MFLFPSSDYRCSPAVLAIVATVLILSGCVSRPTTEVLQPVVLKTDPGQKVSILSVTNRDRQSKDNSFGNRWASDVHYDRFVFSIPPERKGAAITYPSSKPDAKRQFIVTNRETLSRDQLVMDATASSKFDGTVSVFVHGYNYSYQEALFRTAQMSADAVSMSPPIMFSWPSSASVTGYVADKDAVLYSRTELDALLKALANTPRIKRIVLFGHSMGGFLSMEVARQLKLQGHDDVLAKLQIVLAAPDIDVDVFKSQLKDIGRIPNPVTLLVSKSDNALSISSFVGGERPRIGLLDINDPVIQQTAKAEHLTVIDISSLQSSDGLGHDRYASLARFAGDIDKADARMRSNGGNIGAFVFDAAGAAVASPFKLAGQIARQ